MSNSIRLTVVALSLVVAGCVNREDRTTSADTARSHSTSVSNLDAPKQALLGTWQGRDTQGGNAASTQPAGFQFASVSFVNDGTFTAQMRYNGQLMADSGTWMLNGDTLTVKGSHAGAGMPHQGESAAGGAPTASGGAAHHGGPRTYTVQVRGGELMITDPQTRVTVTLDRMKKPG